MKRNRQKWERYEKDGKYYFRPVGKYAPAEGINEPEAHDVSGGCIWGFVAICIAVIAMLIFGLSKCHAQPQIWAGANRIAIEKAMTAEQMWFKLPSANDKLVYKSIAGEVIQYHFNKTAGGWRCTGCSITLPSSKAADEFVSKRLASYRFKPSGDGWQLLTDLTDTRITVIRKGNTFVYSF